VAALMVATIVLSAYMRLVQSGLGCAPWPTCFAQGAPAAAGVALARLLHRIVASVVLVLVILLVLATLTMRPRLRIEGRAAMLLLLLTLALAALGVTMRGSTLPAVVLGNLTGCFLMLAVATRLAWPAAAPAGALATLARVSLLMLLAQIALGAMLSATRTAWGCDGFASCLQQAAALDWSWRLLDPWSNGSLPQAATATAAARGAWLQLLHRSAALALLPLIGALALVLWRVRRRGGAAVLAALLVAQLLVGGLLPASGWPLAQVLVHNLSAALLLALLLRLA
jgi:cytochrome c oxidase assembly protein subunit 15